MDERPIIQQPVNAWTNLAFFWFGLWPLVAVRKDISTVVYLISAAYVGVTSFVFHASITRFWQHLDAAAARTALFTLILHGIHCVSAGRISWGCLAPINLVIAIVLSVFKKEVDEEVGSVNMWIFSVVVLISLSCILLGANTRRILQHDTKDTETTEAELVDCEEDTISDKENTPSKRRFFLGMWAQALAPAVLLGGAVALNRLSNNRTICYPDSSFQGHAVWHILNALASLLLWMFFDNNRLKISPPQADDKPTPNDDNTEKKEKDCDDLEVAETESQSQ